MTNKEIVKSFYEDVFNGWDMSKIDQYVHKDYRQHNPNVADGREGFRAFCEKFLAMKPHMDIVKILEDHDLVCVFFKCTLESGSVNKVFDLYRLEDGMLVEHWDCVEHGIDENNTVSGNGYF